jgi:hypothetical protein
MAHTKTLVLGSRSVKTVAGPVTFLDRVKNYWKFAITAVGTLLVVLNELTPMFTVFGLSQHTVTVVISVVTMLSVFLKSNETWVEDL